MKTLKIFTVILILFSFSKSFAQDSTHVIMPQVPVYHNALIPTCYSCRTSAPSYPGNSNQIVICKPINMDSLRKTPEYIRIDSLQTVEKKRIIQEFDSLSEEKVENARKKAEEAKITYWNAQAAYEMLSEKMEQKRLYIKDPKSLDSIFLPQLPTSRLRFFEPFPFGR